ncbi:hypothetical protein M947_00210 [Sulfurimonas hongkongensis]|uniref:Uncharacterized protein n=1 Tax=Sulfurimonas hongkongensis TaxID=1172190 RepID=T0JUL5_9BACT|nr:hypothetical protein [Sulfurimonas hongkongensis]EQB40707.1 hypothetical protein M947_00210 [Sulfurimonas hongkongensis]
MQKALKDLYGSAILFFYFLKWPYLVGYPFLYFNGLNQNFLLDALWLICLALVIKDIYTMIKNKQINRYRSKQDKEDNPS